MDSKFSKEILRNIFDGLRIENAEISSLADAKRTIEAIPSLTNVNLLCTTFEKDQRQIFIQNFDRIESSSLERSLKLSLNDVLLLNSSYVTILCSEHSDNELNLLIRHWTTVSFPSRMKSVYLKFPFATFRTFNRDLILHGITCQVSQTENDIYLVQSKNECNTATLIFVVSLLNAEQLCGFEIYVND